MYRLLFRNAARRELANLPHKEQLQVSRAIAALAADPRPSGVKKIRESKDMWRIRVGDNRVIYRVQDKQLVVAVVRVRRRGDAYR